MMRQGRRRLWYQEVEEEGMFRSEGSIGREEVEKVLKERSEE